LSILNFIKILSYLYPIRIKKIKSKYHTLELTWNNGKLMLDSAVANYSYGNLHQVFQLAFEQSKLTIKPTGHILLLGLGGGSVIEILEKEYAFKGNITAIEIDAEVISLYKEVFSASHTSTVNTIKEDALDWVNNYKKGVQYDLIVCDLFIDLDVPVFMKDAAFYQKLKMMLHAGGSIYVNTIHQKCKKAVKASLFYPTFKDIEKYEFFDLNEVFVLKT
jgi:spermidine synthase